MNINQCYEILGLKAGASQVEIKHAYRNLAKTCHPDLFFNAPQLKQKAEEEFKIINEAYQQLESHQHNPQISQPETDSTNLSDAEIYYNQAMEIARKGRYQEAIHKFTIAISLNSNYEQAYKYRGLACSKLGYKHRAASDLKKAAEFEQKQGKTAPQSKPPAPKPQQSASSWRCIHTLSGHSNCVFSVAISPDGKTLVSGSSDKTIKIWRLDTGELLRTLTGHLEWVRAVAISPDGQTLVSGSGDHSIKIWDLATGQLLTG